MCLGAIYWAHLDRIYYANDRKDAAKIGFDDEFIYEEIITDEREKRYRDPLTGAYNRTYYDENYRYRSITAGVVCSLLHLHLYFFI